jgi:hypothetical protein
VETNKILHIIRNPFNWSEDDVRKARWAAADLIEEQQAKINRLEGFIKEKEKVRQKGHSGLCDGLSLGLGDFF